MAAFVCVVYEQNNLIHHESNRLHQKKNAQGTGSVIKRCGSVLLSILSLCVFVHTGKNTTLLT